MEKARITIYMDKQLHKSLKKFAVEKEQSVSEIIETITKNLLIQEGFCEQENLARTNNN